MLMPLPFGTSSLLLFYKFTTGPLALLTSHVAKKRPTSPIERMSQRELDYKTGFSTEL